MAGGARGLDRRPPPSRIKSAARGQRGAKMCWSWENQRRTNPIAAEGQLRPRRSMGETMGLPEGDSKEKALRLVADLLEKERVWRTR